MCTHFWRKLVTLNPVSNQTGKRHFSCVSMATNRDLHMMLVTAFHCYGLLKTICFFFQVGWLTFVRFWAETVFFFFLFFLMPSFTKAKTFAKCPLMRLGELLLLFFLLFSVNYFRACFSTYFVMVAVGFKPFCVCHLELKICPAKKRITKKKKTDR